ncbi:hypothetical protein [Mesorhizobium sp. KR9-304]|uniref:hypothetical protein n=1 Tax=Mesorhizobium sp. KR9-304 TaxID=3156614 RepID=UPI0032B338DD
MINKLKTAALSALIGLGTITAMPAAAQAEGVYLNYGTGHHSGVGIGVQIGDYDRHDYREYRRDRRYFRGCSPERALNKAERYGVRRARVIDVNRRTIEVAGRKHGERVRITFARAPNCPIVRW